MIQLTVWMNMPSFYQADFFRSLLASEEIDLQVIYARRLPADRLQLGWEDDLHGYPYKFLSPRRREIDAIKLAWSQSDRIHIVNGIFGEPSFTFTCAALALRGSTYLIHSEASDPSTPRSLARRMAKSALGSILTRRAAGVLSISRLAEDFYRSLKVPEEKIYAFGYFRHNGRAINSPSPSKDNNRIEIIYIGQLVRRKGIDILLEALRPLFAQHRNLFLTIVGTGEMQTALQAQVEALGLDGRVLFEGAINSDSVPARLAGADLLVLPSRWDGWGLVVNEAFSAGVPVVVSDRCGAADLVRQGINGYVFRNESVAELRACLSAFLDAKTNRPQLEASALGTASSISTEAVAPYLINCLKHITGLVKEKPLPPWLSKAVTL
ncbi:MAG TPA: glycosyltransferase family 4 protein [Pyrinomonadaceae bacterium]|nr:glycosyltransferase family 4 protein [Pyrinomonadaceae bacterium]